MIVDASAAVPWYVANEFSASAGRLRRAELRAPSLLLVEVTNAVLKYVRAGRLESGEVPLIQESLRLAVPHLVEDNLLLPSATRIAMETGHKIYDCLYLALAQERKEPLATADGRLAQIASDIGIEVDRVFAA